MPDITESMKTTTVNTARPATAHTPASGVKTGTMDMDTGTPRHEAPQQGIRRVSLLMLAVLAVLGAMAVATARADTPDKTPAPPGVQVMCPVMTDEKIDPDISLEYQGQTVYFCCQKCRWKFEASPQRYTASIVTVSGPGEFEANDRGHGMDHDHDDKSAQNDVLTILGKLHPMVVHFPIALLVTAALARCLMLVGSIGWAEQAVRFCVLIGGVSAVVAAGLGWLNAGWPESGESLGDVIFNHRWLGVSTAVVGVILIVLVEMEASKPTKAPSLGTTLGLLLGAGLVSATGYFGGILVYGSDYLPW